MHLRTTLVKPAACLAALFLCVLPAPAATAQPAGYDSGVAFAPLTLPTPPNRVRSANGLPGPDYWQNRADYQIRATLDPAAKTLSGTVTITYTNHSPDPLETLWLQLDQNLYRPDSRGNLAQGGKPRGTTDGMSIDAAEVEQNGRFVPVQTLVSDTRMQVRLPEVLPGSGGALRLRLRYHYLMPDEAGSRTAWGRARDGEIYDVAQWYPRLAVYDDLRGWDTLPYMAQEFYLEYGDFDFWVTVPADMVVAGTGALQNPGEVLTADQQARLAEARTSDRTVVIRRPADDAAPALSGGTRTWHYRMENTRDVAFSASSTFVWDAARLNLPDGKTALAMSFYPGECVGAGRWSRSTEYLKHAVEEFSRRWYPYPWPTAVNVAGPVGGMEYPGMAFESLRAGGKLLFWVTAHEIGHSWFPMIVGFDERRDAWMDEGFNTFIDVYESDAFNGGEYAPKRDGEYAPESGNPVDEILPVLADPQAPPILARADTIVEKYRHPVTYFKSALGLILLREQILGPARFDPAFRRFVAAWAHKHPKPADFFRAMESEGGEDLSWWWRGWYFNQWTLDLAVAKVAYVDGDPAKGALVTVQARDPLVLPVTLRVAYADGTRRDVQLPAETWVRQGSVDVYVAGGQAVLSATLDPEHHLPDRDRSNDAAKP